MKREMTDTEFLHQVCERTGEYAPRQYFRMLSGCGGDRDKFLRLVKKLHDLFAFWTVEDTESIDLVLAMPSPDRYRNLDGLLKESLEYEK